MKAILKGIYKGKKQFESCYDLFNIYLVNYI